jgi:RNA polymerase sigma-70 factor, ECF subfamily
MPQPDSSEVPARSLLSETGEAGLADLFDLYRDRLRGAVSVRLDPRLRGRIDPSDVIQEAFVEARQRLPEYNRDPRMSPFVWIRFLTMQRMLILHRRHLDAKQRDARLDVSLAAVSGPGASSFHLASMIIESQPGPVETAQLAEQQRELQRALDEMRPDDRDVLVLRHFEHLDNEETAEVLGITAAAASRRYYRALKKLKDALNGLL